MQHGKTAYPGVKKTAGLLLLLAVILLAGAYLLSGEKRTESMRTGAQEPKETIRIVEVIRTIVLGSEKGTPGEAPQGPAGTPLQANSTAPPAKKKQASPEGNASLAPQSPQAPPPGPQASAPAPELRQTIATSPTIKISENEYIAGLETDGKVRIYAHEAEGRRIFTNDSAPDGWFSKIAYDAAEGDCIITVYVDADAALGSQNLTYGCRMRGNIETGCSNTPIANWGQKTGNLYSYTYSDSCAQNGNTVKIDGVQKDSLSSGI